MKWNKLGLIFELKKHNIPWLKSHSLLPTPILLEDRIRVFYTGRNIQGQSRISYIDVEINNPRKIMYTHDTILFEAGKIGTFDDCGTVCTTVIKNDNKIFMYYNGYNVRNTVPWSNSIGLAVSDDNGKSFSKFSEGPIMDRNTIDPYFTITPGIYVKNDIWHMWYTSGTGWKIYDKKPEPQYEIKYAYSTNGLDWKRTGTVCIPSEKKGGATARATVLKDKDIFKMWFCYRGSNDFRDGSDSYRIGYAEAEIKTPEIWTRKDTKYNLDHQSDDYDNKMQAYPGVIHVNDKTYMFYSGNGFGEKGFCCAVLDNSN